MSTKKTPGSKGGRCVRVTTLPPSQCRKSWKSGALAYRISKGRLRPVAGKLYLTCTLTVPRYKWFSHLHLKFSGSDCSCMRCATTILIVCLAPGSSAVLTTYHVTVCCVIQDTAVVYITVLINQSASRKEREISRQVCLSFPSFNNVIQDQGAFYVRQRAAVWGASVVRAATRVYVRVKNSSKHSQLKR
jgi:hypothetical protein